MDDLLDTAPCGFLAFADDGTIVMANATLHDLLNCLPGDLPGNHIQSILSVGAKIFYQTHFFPLLKMHGKAEEIYLSLCSKDGSNVPILANAVRRERDGVVINDCIVLPIRHRNRYEDELLQARKAAEEANRSKAKFLSMMSHEIRTPLQTISGCIDVLSLEIHGPLTDLQLSDLQRISSASEYMLGMTNDILNFARLEAGQVDVRIQTTLLETVLARAETMILPRFLEAGLEYERVGALPETTVQADPDRLQQILLNLLTNAIKFTVPGGRISLAYTHSEDRIQIHIRDTGRGIQADQLGRIFDPFVQVDRHAIASSQQGTGLGLAISRELARAMGGDITVESTLGEGSVFTIALQIP